MEKYTEFNALIKDFIELFDTLIDVEQKKLDAVIANDIAKVEESIKKEQAVILQLRGLERHRESAQVSMGMKDLTFREILEQAPEDVSKALTPMFQELTQKVHTFQSINDNAKDAINVKLHHIQSMLNPSGAGSKVYSASGTGTSTGSSSEETHFTNRFV